MSFISCLTRLFKRETRPVVTSNLRTGQKRQAVISAIVDRLVPGWFNRSVMDLEFGLFRYFSYEVSRNGRLAKRNPSLSYCEPMEVRMMLSATTAPIVQDAGLSTGAPSQTALSDADLLSAAAQAVNAKVVHEFGVLTNAGVAFLVATNGIAFFEVSTITGSDIQLWRSDGTTAGTTLLHDFGGPIVPVTGRALMLTSDGNTNGITFFQLQDINSRVVQLWGSDGTAAGTKLLHDFGGGAGINVVLIDLGNPGGIEIFAVYDQFPGVYPSPSPVYPPPLPVGRFELWGSNGTAQGTSKIYDLQPPTVTTGSGFFAGGSPSSSQKSGSLTGSGSTSQPTIIPWSLSIQITFLKTANGTVLIPVNGLALNPILGGLAFVPESQLLGSNGTASGTKLLHDFGINEVVELFGPEILNVASPQLFLGNGTHLMQVTNRVTHDVQLWGTDGTAAGTKLFHDFGTSGVSLAYQGISNGVELFSVTNDHTHTVQLWGSNGTVTGTGLVRDFGAVGISISPVATVNGIQLLAVTNANTHDVQLWRSNGRTSGTFSLVDFGAGAGIAVNYLDIVNGTALMGVSNPIKQDTQLWGSNGFVSGTALLEDFVSGSVVIQAVATVGPFEILSVSDSVHHDVQIWRTNGKRSGTTLLHDFGSEAVTFNALGGPNSTEFFTVTNTVTNDVQLWRTNGNASGTKRLYDFGTIGVSFFSFGTVNRKALFTVTGKLRFPVYGLGTQESQLWAIR